MSDALSWIDSAKRPAHRILPNKIVRREYDFESQQYCENQRPTAWPFEPGKGEEQDGIHLIASCMQQQLLSCEPLERWKPGPPLVKVKSIECAYQPLHRQQPEAYFKSRHAGKSKPPRVKGLIWGTKINRDEEANSESSSPQDRGCAFCAAPCMVDNLLINGTQATANG